VTPIPAPRPVSDTDPFERERPRLVGLAYRMLGTVADAEDVVQDVWLRWRTVRPGELDRPEAWLTTVTTRVALDHLRAARRRREAYVGPWLPEPLVAEAGPAEVAELAESLRFGFLTVLDQLRPVERAVFLLADVFAVPYADIAVTVGKSEAACRQIASRARKRVRPAHPPAAGPADGPVGHRADTGSDRAVVDDLMTAVAIGDVDLALRYLAPDVVCVSDGGASRRAARRPVVGADRVVRFLVNLTRRQAGRLTARPATVNGDVGSVVSLDGAIDVVTVFELEGGRVAPNRMVRNPDKLVHVEDALSIR
jgi:RNA polymerase sigma-70 factor (ECF subfamily)